MGFLVKLNTVNINWLHGWKSTIDIIIIYNIIKIYHYKLKGNFNSLLLKSVNVSHQHVKPCRIAITPDIFSFLVMASRGDTFGSSVSINLIMSMTLPCS